MFSRYRQGSAPFDRTRSAFAARSCFACLEPAAPSAASQPGKQGRCLKSWRRNMCSRALPRRPLKSIASENAARFAAMDAAQGNVSKKLDQLRQEAHQARQTEITTELLDLITGAEASAGNSAGRRRGASSLLALWLISGLAKSSSVIHITTKWGRAFNKLQASWPGV